MDKPGPTHTDDDDEDIMDLSKILQKSIGIKDGSFVNIEVQDGNIKLTCGPKMTAAMVSLILQSGYAALMKWTEDQITTKH